MRRPAWPVVLAIVALIPAACGGGATPAPTQPPALAAGTYTSKAFQPPVTYTLPAGWWNPSDEGDYFELRPVASDLVGIHLFRGPRAASQEASCPTSAEPGAGMLSSQLVAWVRSLPGLSVSTPRMASVGGFAGTEIDVAIKSTWTASCPYAGGIPSVPLFVGSTSTLRWTVSGSERLRLDFLDVPGGGTIVVDVDAFEGTDWDALLAAAAPIVASLSFAAP